MAGTTAIAGARYGPPRAAETKLRGRERELHAIDVHLDRLRCGLGTVAVFEGPAGIGKSRLLAEVLGRGERLQMATGLGAADPSESVVQLAPLLRALFEGGAAPILDRRSLAEARRSPEERYWLLQDVESLLERAAQRGPVVVCLDDLQWADAATAAALHTLPDRLAAIPVGWFLGTRLGPRTATLRDALGHLAGHGADVLRIDPLSADAVAQVVADVLDAEPNRELLDFASRTDGTPYLLVELIQGLRDEGAVQVSHGTARLAHDKIPHRVANGTRRRLERLTPEARHLATVAASLGRRFSFTDVGTMLDAPATTLLAPLEELLNAGILVERDRHLGFVHDLTYDGIRASIPVTARRALDRQAAYVLLAGGAVPVEVAMQVAASAEPGDDAAITTLLRAAETLASTNPRAAADLSRRALALAPPNHPLRGPLVAGTAVWLHAAALPEEARTFADTALRSVLSATQEAEVRLSIAGMFSISPDDRADASRAALALADLPPTLRGRHLAVLFHNLVTAGRFDEARPVREQARESVDENADVGGQFIFQLAESGLDYADGRFEHGLQLTETALRTSLLTSDETRADLTRQWRCDLLMVLDRLDEALDLSLECFATAQRNRQGWALRNYEVGRARLYLQVGRIADAIAILQERFSVDTAPEVVNVLDAAGLSTLGRLAIHTGDTTWARHTAHIAEVMLDKGAPLVRHHAAWLLALQALARGDPFRAHLLLCAHGEEDRLHVLPLFPSHLGDEARLLKLALTLGDTELAEAARRSAELRSSHNPGVQSLAAAALHASGLLRRDGTEIAKAVDLFEQGPRKLATASALEDLAEVALDDGDRLGAVDALTRALTIYAEAAATADARRARARLRDLGVRRRLATTQHPRHGWAALTDSETAVVHLVAEGCTNREVAARLYVSPHTVSGHLRSIFAKVGVNSRVELTRLASQPRSHPGEKR
jgi:DNA-binding CsgD family transcriptional regulator